MSAATDHAAPSPRRRRLAVAVGGALAVLGLAVAAITFSNDDDADSQRRELTGALATHLRESAGLDPAAATCVAGAAVEAVGADRLDGADLEAGKVPDEVETDFVAAVSTGMSECVEPGAAPVEDSEASVEETVDSLTAIYADQLGIDVVRAACVSQTVVGWQIGPDAVPDGASKPLTDALATCGIDPAEVRAPSSEDSGGSVR